ncbi:MAG: Smr/MutS family protein, partial [Candidatus Latescibacterota bacterium]
VRETHGRIKKMLEKTRKTRKPKPKPARMLSPGDIVSLNPSGQPRGRVIEVAKNSATVDINGKKINVRMRELYRVDEDPGAGDEPSERSTVHTPVGIEPLHTTTVDVRGFNQEEALDEVDRFIDRAVLSGVQEITIIHGIGEGVLLHAVRERLRSDPRVESSRQGLPGEGGLGVTVIGLK